MTRMIADLLGAREPTFTLLIRDLERRSGRPSVDVRLTADIVKTTHQKAPQILLYPKDPQAKELYAGLQHKLSQHDATLVRALGGTDPANAQDVYKRVLTAAQKLDMPQDCWALKASAAKKLLTKMPPKKTMKQLGYKSVESMLKRESVPRLYTAMRFIERPEWLKNYYLQYKTLKPTDFELRKIEIVTTDTKKWQDFAAKYVATSRHNVVRFNDLGAIVVMPLPIASLPGLATLLLAQIVHDIDEIRIYSAFGKLQQMKPNFGEIMLKALFDHDHHAATLGEQPVPWRVVHRHYATSPHFPQVFDPHVQAEDVMWRHAGQVLANYVPDMLFWHDTDHVGYLHEGKPVSYNLMDVAVNYCNRLHFNDRVTHNLQAALWNELLRRYVSQEAIEQAVLAQLDHSLPEGMPQDELVGIF